MIAEVTAIVKVILEKLLSEKLAFQVLLATICTPLLFEVFSKFGLFNFRFFLVFGTYAQLAMSFFCSLTISIVLMSICWNLFPQIKRLTKNFSDWNISAKVRKQFPDFLPQEQRIMKVFWNSGSTQIADKKALQAFTALQRRGCIIESPYFDGAYTLTKPAADILKKTPWLLASCEDLEYFALSSGNLLQSAQIHNLYQQIQSNKRLLSKYRSRHPEPEIDSFVQELELLRSNRDERLEADYPQGLYNKVSYLSQFKSEFLKVKAIVQNMTKRADTKQVESKPKTTEKIDNE